MDLNALLAGGAQKHTSLVKEEIDRRYNKLSNYSIFTIVNTIVYVILEVKLRVGIKLTAPLGSSGQPPQPTFHVSRW